MRSGDGALWDIIAEVSSIRAAIGNRAKNECRYAERLKLANALGIIWPCFLGSMGYPMRPPSRSRGDDNRLNECRTEMAAEFESIMQRAQAQGWELKEAAIALADVALQHVIAAKRDEKTKSNVVNLKARRH